MTMVLNGTSGVTTNSGTLISATTIGVGGATPANTGAGVSFPATQSASSDVNTLDDYEEGTWAPGAGNLTVSGSFSSSGTYTKVGRLVTVQATLTGSTSITGPGGNFFTGLPFTPVSISAGSLIVVNRGAGCQVEAYTNGNVYVSGFSAIGTVYVTVSYEV
jgi:hypothetical protein